MRGAVLVLDQTRDLVEVGDDVLANVQVLTSDPDQRTARGRALAGGEGGHRVVQVEELQRLPSRRSSARPATQNNSSIGILLRGQPGGDAGRLDRVPERGDDAVLAADLDLALEIGQGRTQVAALDGDLGPAFVRSTCGSDEVDLGCGTHFRFDNRPAHSRSRTMRRTLTAANTTQIRAPSATVTSGFGRAQGAILGALERTQNAALEDGDAHGVEDVAVRVDQDADVGLDLRGRSVEVEHGLVACHGGVLPVHPGRHFKLGTFDVN